MHTHERVCNSDDVSAAGMRLSRDASVLGVVVEGLSSTKHESTTLTGQRDAACFPTGEESVCNGHARGVAIDAVVDEVQEDGDVDLCVTLQTVPNW